MNIVDLKYNSLEIKEKRKIIAKRFIDEVAHITDKDFEEIKTSDLKRLVMLYDEVFLEDSLKKYTEVDIEYSFSRQLKKSGGITKVQASRKDGTIINMEIKMNINMIFDFKYDCENRYACGLEVHSRLDALMIILEHEICHVLEYITYGNSSCKKERFKNMATSIFDHREFTHGLMTQVEKNMRTYNIVAGDTVRFSIDNKKFKGSVIRINKRATVYVKNANGGFLNKKTGKMCNKYLVPLNLLTKM